MRTITRYLRVTYAHSALFNWLLRILTSFLIRSLFYFLLTLLPRLSVDGYEWILMKFIMEKACVGEASWSQQLLVRISCKSFSLLSPFRFNFWRSRLDLIIAPMNYCRADNISIFWLFSLLPGKEKDKLLILAFEDERSQPKVRMILLRIIVHQNVKRDLILISDDESPVLTQAMSETDFLKWLRANSGSVKHDESKKQTLINRTKRNKNLSRFISLLHDFLARRGIIGIRRGKSRREKVNLETSDALQSKYEHRRNESYTRWRKKTILVLAFPNGKSAN